MARLYHKYKLEKEIKMNQSGPYHFDDEMLKHPAISRLRQLNIEYNSSCSIGSPHVDCTFDELVDLFRQITGCLTSICSQIEPVTVELTRMNSKRDTIDRFRELCMIMMDSKSRQESETTYSSDPILSLDNSKHKAMCLPSEWYL